MLTGERERDWERPREDNVEGEGMMRVRASVRVCWREREVFVKYLWVGEAGQIRSEETALKKASAVWIFSLLKPPPLLCSCLPGSPGQSHRAEAARPPVLLPAGPLVLRCTWTPPEPRPRSYLSLQPGTGGLTCPFRTRPPFSLSVKPFPLGEETKINKWINKKN